MLPAPVIAQLKDLPHKVELPPALDAELTAFLSKAAPASSDAAAQGAYLDAGAAVVERCLQHLDGEMARVIDAKMQLGDVGGVQRKLVGEPKAQVALQLNDLKARLTADRTRWVQRTRDQAQEVAGKLDEVFREIETKGEPSGHELVVDLSPAWRRRFEEWLETTFSQWGQHHLKLVEAKCAALLEQPFAELARIFNEPVKARWPLAPPLRSGAPAAELPPVGQHHEAPTSWEAFFESLKGGIQTVAMLAGMVIVPVVGNFSHEQPTHVKAAIMSACVAPIMGFSIWAARRQRRKIFERLEEKSRQQLAKDLDAFARGRIEKFRTELERHVSEYLNNAGQVLASQIEQQGTTAFSSREERALVEAAKLQHELEKIAEKQAMLKQLRGQLAGTVLVEVRKRRRDLQSAAS